MIGWNKVRALILDQRCPFHGVVMAGQHALAMPDDGSTSVYATSIQEAIAQQSGRLGLMGQRGNVEVQTRTVPCFEDGRDCGLAEVSIRMKVATMHDNTMQTNYIHTRSEAPATSRIKTGSMILSIGIVLKMT